MTAALKALVTLVPLLAVLTGCSSPKRENFSVPEDFLAYDTGSDWEYGIVTRSTLLFDDGRDGMPTPAWCKGRRNLDATPWEGHVIPLPSGLPVYVAYIPHDSRVYVKLPEHMVEGQTCARDVEFTIHGAKEKSP